ncbi:hypothetical protein ALI22I_30730 [Saccharothrix sp. ALI-22-I]|uniref:response regulator transcription factor n=1 Tax=Saccharothrix sp. ALI-22-I TaxID=1933778 RepID=UPI00097BC6C6|nr:response regulator transcription factor [Saccharothrix sp. ALI-22-I]ONI84858.1 hypothetical protein ALI22I_30730 [Saccharothrix sp. ALI-22-I]
MNVLLIGVDRSGAYFVMDTLRHFEIRVEWASSGARVLDGLGAYDLILLDLGMPDSVDVCREIRARGEVPVVILADGRSESDVVAGLEIGADDYVDKPVRPRELVARMRAVMRRYRLAGVPAVQECGAVVIDRRSRRVAVAGEPVALTTKEFDLLALLATDLGAVVGRRRIMDAVWDPRWSGPTKTVDVHVSALRRKLGDTVRFEAVRGVGYRLEQVNRDRRAALSSP